MQQHQKEVITDNGRLHATGIGAHICQPDLLCWKIHCLLGVGSGMLRWCWQGLWNYRIITPCKSLCGHQYCQRRPGAYKCDYMHLGAMVKGMGAQVVSSLVFPVKSKSLRGNGSILWVNSCLPSWKWQSAFVFYDYGDPSLKIEDC